MARSLLLTIGFWLGASEWLAERCGWWGLAWRRGGRRASPLLLAGAALACMRGGWLRRLLGLALAALPALALQLAASSLRGRRLDPAARLRPGPHADRTVTNLRIPMHDGYLPAILVEPMGASLDRQRSLVSQSAVCILHGSGDHKAAYTWWLADALLAQGMAALLIDLDGHGENPRAQAFPTIIEDVHVAVGWLRGRYTRVGVLGLSLGGCVAARAIADGVPADALVVMEAPPRLQFSRADMRREALALLHPRALDMLRDCTAYQLARAWPSAPIRAAISTWDLIDALDLLGSLPRIRAPLLLLYGASDAIVKPAQAAQARAAAPVHAEFHLVPGASHLTLFVRRDIQAQVAAWLAQRLGKSEEMTR